MAGANHSRKLSIVQRDSEELAKNYPSWFRKCEWFGLIAFFSLIILCLGKLFFTSHILWTGMTLGILFGWIGADFLCGTVHWFADTWGSADTTLLGPALIRPFREHHVDQLAMTRHDFVETNAAAALGGLPLLVICYFIPLQEKSFLYSFLFFLLFSVTLFGFLTNQIHKWSHSRKVPKFIRQLQKRRLILHPTDHQIHHRAPYNKYYCITNGWLNPVLTSIGFFPTCEKIITKITGALPRKDDIGEDAARKLIEEEPERQGQKEDGIAS